MRYIKLRKKKKRIYFYFNSIILGYSYREVDGFYVFSFNEFIKGVWSDYVLREIANILTDLNMEYSNELSEHLLSFKK